jgi:hypothetical protein
MATSDSHAEPTLRERLRRWREKRRQRAAERASTRPDMESHAEGAAFRQAGERSLRDPSVQSS